MARSINYVALAAAIWGYTGGRIFTQGPIYRKTVTVDQDVVFVAGVESSITVSAFTDIANVDINLITPNGTALSRVRMIDTTHLGVTTVSTSGTIRVCAYLKETW